MQGGVGVGAEEGRERERERMCTHLAPPFICFRPPGPALCKLGSAAASAAAAAKSFQSCPTVCDPIDSSPPDSPSLGFSRQKHWSGLPFPSPLGVLFYLKSSLWSSDLSLTFLCSILLGFSLPCLLATAILDSFPLSNNGITQYEDIRKD